MDYIKDHEGKLEASFSIRELANCWGLSTRTIQRAIAKGLLGAFRVGRNIRIPRSEIIRWETEQMEIIKRKAQDLKNLLSSHV